MPSRLLSLQRRGIVVVSAVSMAWTRVESQYRPPSASSRPLFLAAYGNTGVDLIMECLADLGLTRCNFWRGERERVGERERRNGERDATTWVACARGGDNPAGKPSTRHVIYLLSDRNFVEGRCVHPNGGRRQASFPSVEDEKNWKRFRSPFWSSRLVFSIFILWGKRWILFPSLVFIASNFSSVRAFMNDILS